MVLREGVVLPEGVPGAMREAPTRHTVTRRQATPRARAAAGRGASVSHAAWALVASALGCNAIFGIDGLRYGPPGGGGDAGTAGVGGTAGAATTSSSTTGAGGSTSTTATTTTSSSTSGTGAAGGAGGGGTGGEGSASLVSCYEQYGSLPGYQLCGESADYCDLDIDLGAVSSCFDLCALGGGSCAHAAASDGECGTSGPGLSCGVTGPDRFVCSCSRGCDGQAPCIPPALCIFGQCD